MRRDEWSLGTGMRPPAISLGMILFTPGDERGPLYLVVRRRNTVGFMDIIRGKYRVDHMEHLARLVDVMTLEEKEAVATWPFDRLWSWAWGPDGETKGHGGERVAGNIALDALRRGISVDGRLWTIRTIVDSSSTAWTEPEWEFPKGHKNAYERDTECARRECCEETGLPPSAFSALANVHPLEEIFTGSNLRSYKYKYFLGYVPDASYSLQNFQRTEIGAVAWLCKDECLQAIRPYHQERQSLIEDLDDAIRHVRLFSV
jgi:8-oxo-dGTP pyrophosphatase MutT (NUDIX family)